MLLGAASAGTADTHTLFFSLGSHFKVRLSIVHGGLLLLPLVNVTAEAKQVLSRKSVWTLGHH